MNFGLCFESFVKTQYKASLPPLGLLITHLLDYCLVDCIFGLEKVRPK